MKIGFVEVIYGSPKGHSYVIRQLLNTLQEAKHEVHMYRIRNFQIPEEFSMPDTLETESSCIISKENFEKWLDKVKPDYCVFMEYAQWWEEDHDKLEICKQRGIKTIGFLVYEKLDWNKAEHYKKYTSIICPTSFQTKLMRSKGLYNTFHIPWGIDFKEFDAVKEAKRDDKKTVFFHCAGSGGVDNRKNTQKIIEAYKQIQDENTALKITHLGNKVFSRRDIIGLTKYSDVLINTAKWDSIGLNCQPQGSKIYTKNGIDTIENIKIGDKVLTHNNKFEKVINTFTGKNDLYTIKCDYTTDIELTDEHPILAIKSTKSKYKARSFNLKPEWIKTKDITSYDFLAVPKPKYIKHYEYIKIIDYINNKNIIEKNGYIRDKYSKNMKNIKVSMYDLMKKHNMKKNTMWRILNNINTKENNEKQEQIRKEYNNFKIKIPNKIIIDKDFCRLLGLYVAEGWSEKQSAFGFAFHTKEKEYQKFVLETMKQKFNINGKLRIDGNRTSICFYNSIVNKFFEKLCNKYAHNKDVPNFLLHEKLYLQKEFIKGYFDGDGHIEKNKKVSAVTVSKKLAYNIKYLLLRQGILSNISKYKGRKNVKIVNYICDTKDFYIIRLAFSKKMCVLFNLKYKKSRYEFYFEDNNYFYVNVRSKKMTKNKVKVYNITVEKDNSYCGEIVLHNSLEANVCGKPVIVCDMAPVNELVTDSLNGFLVKAKKGVSEYVTCPSYDVDVDDLAMKMQICKNKAVLDSLKHNARKFAEVNFDWDKNKVHFLKLFKEEKK